jgi:hypothetical protein
MLEKKTTMAKQKQDGWHYSDGGTFRSRRLKPTFHNGKPYMLFECSEWVGGRWEGFVAMHPLREGMTIQ